MILPSKRKMKALTQRLGQQHKSNQCLEIDDFSFKSAEQLMAAGIQIGVKEIETLPQRHQIRARAIIVYNLEELQGDERDKFVEQVSPYLSQTNQNDLLRDRNHFQISNAIVMHIQATKTFPNITALSKRTGLSRPTISKHLEGMNIDDFIGEELSKIRMVFSAVMGSVVNEAIEGNMQAAKLYFDVLNMRQPNISTIIGHQQNNLTVNNN